MKMVILVLDALQDKLQSSINSNTTRKFQKVI